jgi:hypothetical protein
VVEASPEKLLYLQELQRRRAEQIGKQGVFRAMKFEPNCKVRQAAAEELGYELIVDAVEAGADLPPNCGECPQERFLAAYNEPNTDQLYGGAAGGGKTVGNLFGTLRACFEYPGLQAFWFRRSFPELHQSVLRLLGRFRFAEQIGARWNAAYHELTFANGSILTFGHAKNVKEATALLSAEIQLLVLDERTTIPPDVVDYLYTRVRSGIPGLPCLGIRSATNPGEIGHSRVKQDYVEATKHGEVEIIDKAGRLKRFIQAKISDTPQLGPEYAKTFDILGEQLAKAYRDGDWDVFAGQVFSEWRYDRHVVKPFRVPLTWLRWGGIDWGHRAPSAVIKAGIDQDDRVWVYWEFYKAEVGEKGLADVIRASGPEHIVYAFDPAMSAKLGDAKPVAAVLKEEGIRLKKANNDRLSGWQRIHTYLADGPACAIHRAPPYEWESCPMLHVFDSCHELIRTLPAVPYNVTGNPEDVDTRSEDHLPDALRYLVMELGTLGRPFLFDETLPDFFAAGGKPIPPVIPGRMIAGNTGTGLLHEESQEDNGKVKASPFN